MLARDKAASVKTSWKMGNGVPSLSAARRGHPQHSLACALCRPTSAESCARVSVYRAESMKADTYNMYSTTSGDATVGRGVPQRVNAASDRRALTSHSAKLGDRNAFNF